MTNLPFSSPDQSPGPLAGVVIADFSRVLAGPYCSMLLADLGATVIKVESPGGDDTRQWLPPETHGMSTYFMSANRNKHSIALNLKDESDLATAHRLVDRADVLIENFKPGGLEKFGLDRSQTAQRWPKLIHASINGFGSQGGAGLAGYDLLVQALSGFMHVTGSEESGPQKAGVAIVDIVTGLHCAIGILAALVERHDSQQGQSLEVSLLSAALSGLANQATAYVAAGHDPQRMGNDHPSLFPYGPFATKDKTIILACGNDSQFALLARHLGKPDLASDESFSTMRDRNNNREELRAEIEEALAAHDAHYWFDHFRSVGVMCAPINSISEGVDFAAQLDLEPVVSIRGADGQDYSTIRNPLEYSRSSINYHSAPPSLDDSSAAIRQWLDED